VLVLQLDEQIAMRLGAETSERTAEWVSQPVVLSTEGESESIHYVLRCGSRSVFGKWSSLQNFRRATLELTWRYKDQSTTWTRVLFDRDNVKPAIPWHETPRAGDRYAIVLAAGPLVPEVLATRTRMFELPLYTPVDDEPSRELLRLGTRYQVDSDERTRKFAEECKVDVAWTTPRITIVAAESPADGKGEPGLTVDALADSVEATGPRSREFHVARGARNRSH
jgi:hypothetical protein